jgi:hypothetical protein
VRLAVRRQDEVRAGAEMRRSSSSHSRSMSCGRCVKTLIPKMKSNAASA